MKRLLIGASAVALIAIPAWAIAEHQHRGMKDPQTRAEAVAKVKEHFAEVDVNKDGAITREEVDAYKDSRRKDMQDKMFAALDTDKNGQISRDEFASAHREGGMGHKGMGERMHGGMRRGGMMMGGDLFTTADTNSDGKVTLTEATGKALEMFDRADTNKDGTVTPEERRAAWKGWMEQHPDKAS